jgi:multidrug resistance efflux pump
MEALIAQTQTEIERSLVRAPVDGELLQVNVRPGEYVGTPAGKDLIVIGDMRQPRIRVDIDESDIPRFAAGTPAQAVVRGEPQRKIELRYVRVEPYVVPKRSLTGANTERVDTRVLQVLYDIVGGTDSLFVGQQVDVFLQARPPHESKSPATTDLPTADLTPPATAGR